MDKLKRWNGNEWVEVAAVNRIASQGEGDGGMIERSFYEPSSQTNVEIWDGNYEIYYLLADGSRVYVGDAVRTAIIPVTEGNQYIFSGGNRARFRWNDSNGEVVHSESLDHSSKPITLVAPFGAVTVEYYYTNQSDTNISVTIPEYGYGESDVIELIHMPTQMGKPGGTGQTQGGNRKAGFIKNAILENLQNHADIQIISDNDPLEDADGVSLEQRIVELSINGRRFTIDSISSMSFNNFNGAVTFNALDPSVPSSQFSGGRIRFFKGKGICGLTVNNTFIFIGDNLIYNTSNGNFTQGSSTIAVEGDTGLYTRLTQGKARIIRPVFRNSSEFLSDDIYSISTSQLQDLGLNRTTFLRLFKDENDDRWVICGNLLFRQESSP